MTQILAKLDAKNKTKPWIPVALAMFVIAWGGNEFTPLLVMYRQSQGFSAPVVDMLLFAYVLGLVPGLLIGGPLSDRFGRRLLMVPAPTVAVIGSAVLAIGAESASILVSGRVLSGVAMGLAMAVGGSWVKELSGTPWDSRATVGSGARRAAMSLTTGFASGAGSAGVLAQWFSWPTVLPYLVHILISIPVGIALWAVPETRMTPQTPGRLVDDLKIPVAGHRRFWFVVIPVAPWVFGAASTAYAVLPALMMDHSGGLPIAFSALLCVVALSCGFAIQAVGRKIDTHRNARAVVVALLLIASGMVLAALAAQALTVMTVIVAAAVLGCGYGMALVSGLQEIQRIAGPDDLAGLTAVFYSLSYLGFASPAVLAILSDSYTALSYPRLLLSGAVVALLCLVVVVRHWSQNLPQR
ncbi:MAG: MFS transporter [Mycobacteriaceae bacterium]